jgi:hypothetical protein
MRTSPSLVWRYLVVLSLALALSAPACAGQCPTPAAPVSVASTPLPCQSGPPGEAVAGDPLTLVGGHGMVFGRVDVGAIRRSPYGALMQRAFDAFVSAEVRGAEGEAMLDGMARTDVIAVAVDPARGVIVVAQGRYTDADADAFNLSERHTRRQHTIRSRRRTAVSVASGRYLIVSDSVGVEAVLDRIDGLEDPAPVGGVMLAAATAMSSYHSYFSVIGIPGVVSRRDFEREEGLEGVHADLRWAALTISQGSSSVDVNGRVHTVSESSARAILDKSVEIQQLAAADMDREVPVLATAARAVSMSVQGTDATLTFQADDAQSRAMIDAVASVLEEAAQRRSSYSVGSGSASGSATTTATSP